MVHNPVEDRQDAQVKPKHPASTSAFSPLQAPITGHGSIGHWAVFILILLLAFGLRTWQLAGSGLFTGDEAGGYYGAPARVAALLKWQASTNPKEKDLSSQMAAIFAVQGGPGDLTGRPIMSGLTLVTFLIFGISIDTLLFMNAFLGVATVGLLYFITRRIWPEGPEALLAMLALAVSGFHILWSRNGFAHALTTFWLALGVACYVEGILRYAGQRARLGWLALTGVCFGAAFATHQVALFYIVAGGIAECVRIVKERDFVHGRGNLVVMGGAFIVFMILVQVVTVLMPATLPMGFSKGSHPTYFETAFGLAREARDYLESSLGTRLSGYASMPFFYGEGVIFSILAAIGLLLVLNRSLKEQAGWVRGLLYVGMLAAFVSLFLFGDTRFNFGFVVVGFVLLVLCISRQATRGFIIAVLVLCPMGALLLVNGPSLDRNLAPLTPWVAILVGTCLAAVWRSLQRPAYRWLAVGLFLAVQLVHDATFLRVKSGYAQAAQWLEDHGGGFVAVAGNDYGRETRWYANGIARVGAVRQVHTDGRLEMRHGTWLFPITARPGEACYIGTIGLDLNSLPESLEWLSVLSGLTPAAVFPQHDSYALKKMELLNRLHAVAQHAGLRPVEARLEKQLERMRAFLAIETVSLYRMPDSLRCAP